MENKLLKARESINKIDEEMAARYETLEQKDPVELFSPDAVFLILHFP